MSWKRCPECKKVCRTIDSRWTEDGAVRRRHQCSGKKCGYRFTTIEVPVPDGVSVAGFHDPYKAARNVVMAEIGNYLRKRIPLR